VSAVRLALFLWGGLFLVLGPIHQPGDGDLYWQRWLGDLILRTHHLPTALGSETFTAAGAPWVPQEWLFSVAVALAANLHLILALDVAMASLPVAILISIYLRSRDVSSPEAVGIMLLFCGIAFLASFGVRAQVLGWAGLAAFIFFLERRDRWYYAAFPAAIIWANLHASVAIAPVIVLARVAAAVSDGGLRALRTSRDLYMLPAVVLAMFCTPLGWRLPYYAVALAGSPIRHYIQEWQPASLHDGSFTFGALPLALAIVLGGRATLLGRKAQSYPAAVLFAAALFAVRNVALFAIVAAPLAAAGLDARFPGLRDARAKLRELEPVALASMGIAIILSGTALARIQARAPSPLPTTAIAVLASDGSDHRLLCENFTWCSAALQFPNLRVFIDGRCDAYPLTVWRKYIAAIDLTPHWRRPLNEYAVDAVVAKRGGDLATALAAQPQWRRSFEDRSYVIFRAAAR
jgi:hypothetical protein